MLALRLAIKEALIPNFNLGDNILQLLRLDRPSFIVLNCRNILEGTKFESSTNKFLFVYQLKGCMRINSFQGNSL